jgi:hypothetical protein
MESNILTFEKLSEYNKKQLADFNKQLDEYDNSPLIVDELPPVVWITNKGNIISNSKSHGRCT